MCVSLPAGTYKALGTRAGKTSAWDLALVPVNLSQTRLKSSNGRRNVRHAALLMRTYSQANKEELLVIKLFWNLFISIIFKYVHDHLIILPITGYILDVCEGVSEGNFHLLFLQSA